MNTTEIRKAFSRKAFGVPVLLLLVIVSAAGGALATIMLSKDIGVSVTIKGYWGMAILDVDGVTELTKLEFGELYLKESKTLPNVGADRKMKI